MPEPFLLFDLYGPFASWGDVAIGEVRPTFTRPSRSAVLGLIAAALGIRRSDADRQRTLCEGYGFGVRVDSPGQLLLDYHTAQVPTGKKARGLPTRRHELEQEGLNTTLSMRSYRTDTLATACIWSRAEARWSLHHLIDALERPYFPLYLGRRACSLSLPLAPRIVEAEGIVEAFDSDDEQALPLKVEVRDRMTSVVSRTLYFDADAPGVSKPTRVIFRRDEPINRGRWTFADREEMIIDL